MNTNEFLSFILPADGYYIFAKPLDNGGYKHTVFESVDALADYADSHPHNAFYACSSFREKSIKVEAKGEVKIKRRTQTNVLKVKSQWLDIDCGKKQYPTQKDGLRDLKRFCDETTLPMPNIIVNSGGGLHVYWVFERAVDAEVWTKVATMFKKVTKLFKFSQDDTSRTSDRASVLRPVGSINAKPGRDPKKVRIVGAPNLTPVKFNKWANTVFRLSKTEAAETTTNLPAKAAKTDDAMDFLSHLADRNGEFPKASAIQAANHCAVLANFRDTKGATQGENLWYAMLGLVKHCVEGDALCHEWSSGHPDYFEDECQSKIDQWKVGPTTCERFKDCDDSNLCAGCQHDVKSPISLGRLAPEQSKEVVVGESTLTLPELPEGLRDNYRYVVGDGLKVRMENDKGVEYWTTISRGFVRVVDVYYDTDAKGYAYQTEVMIRPEAGWRIAGIQASAIAQGGNALYKETGAKLGVMPMGPKQELEKYMKTYADIVQQTTDEVKMHDHMGWVEDGFLLGDIKYFEDTRVSPVKIGERIKVEAIKFSKRAGDLDRYIHLINYMYNRPRYQAYQFTYLAGFGSALLGLLYNTPIGIVLSAWSREPGRGKSTACRLAQGIWAVPQRVSDGKGITDIAATYNTAYRRNLPMVIDEVSDWGAERIGSFAYHYTSGMPRERGHKDGGVVDNSHLMWQNFVLLNSNTSAVNALNLYKRDCTPQIVRVWEYNMDTKNSDMLDPVEAKVVADELAGMGGLAGDKFLRYVVPNKARITKQLREFDAWFTRKCNFGPEARYWGSTAACIMEAAMITKRLGLHDFDLKELQEWMVKSLLIMKSSLGVAKEASGYSFSDMMADLQSGFLMTTNEGDLREKRPAQFMPGHGPVRGSVTGRVIEDRGLVYVSINAIKNWCRQHKENYDTVLGTARNNGWLRNEGTRYALGKGMRIPLPQTTVIELDWSAYEQMLRVVDEDKRSEDNPDSAEIIPLASRAKTQGYAAS